MRNYLFTSEAVSEGHPDKICDQISDAILDQFLAQDPNSRIACETLVTRGLVVLSGEISSNTYVDLDTLVRNTLKKIGYTRSEFQFDAESCAIISSIHAQSPDIARGVDRKNPEEQGAGDQGMMFGYACAETNRYIPLTTDVANAILKELAFLRKSGEIPYLRPDAKSQVTVEYNQKNIPVAIRTIVISTQHDEFILPSDNSEEAQQEADRKMQQKIEKDIREILIPRVKILYDPSIQALFENFTLWVNPTGKFVLGGPAGDTGLTGRKIICDTYGGRGAHGGGAFSGKDPSKVDRSAAYAMRHLAKNMVAAGIADQVLIQVAYAIGVAEPVSLFVNTFHSAKINKSDSEIAEILKANFKLTPYNIEQRLSMRTPIYSETAVYGHFGRNPRTLVKEFEINGQKKKVEVELFPWEKLDLVDALRVLFN